VRATLLCQVGDVRVEDVPDPKIQQPTDAVVRIVAGCVYGSDLWPYKPAPLTDNPVTWATSSSAWSRRPGPMHPGPPQPLPPPGGLTPRLVFRMALRDRMIARYRTGDVLGR